MSKALTKYFAVARLSMTNDGSVDLKTPATVISSYCANNKDPQLDLFKNHTNKLLKDALGKMKKAEKKINLRSEEHKYVIHIYTVQVPNDSQLLAFFAIVDLDFGSAFTIVNLWKDVKSKFFAAVSAKQIRDAKANGSVHKKTQKVFAELSTKYGSSKIEAISQKVDKVKNQMQQNIDNVLANEGALNKLQDDAEQLDEDANRYRNKATKIRRNACWDMWKSRLACIAAGLTLIGILAIIIAVMT